MNLFSGVITNLERGLNYASLKQKTLSQNIANVDTPNYKASDVSFKNYFEEATLKATRTDNRHLDFKRGEQEVSIVKQENTSYKHNGNNVDIDKDMTQLAENGIYQQALVQRISGKFNSLQSVVRGGK